MTCGLKRALCSVRAGYSLLEVIVVVAILAIAATVSGPSIGRMITSQQAQNVVRGVATEMGALRAEAFLSSTRFNAQEAQGRLSQSAPSDWLIEVEDSVSIGPGGYCTPGAVVLISPSGRRWALSVSEGTCDIRGVGSI
jgi:prepilin-type N-terminal cleavage/methylation domain-containing protein